MKCKDENIKISLSEFQYDEKLQLFRLPEEVRNFEQEYNYSDGNVEKYILSAIKRTNDLSDGSEELMRLAKDWPSYYHLGIGRSNVLKCLDLKSQIKVLELGSGCGAVTRYLGEKFKSVDCVEGSLLRAEITRERCRDLRNVKVFCSDINKVKFEQNYDMVTLIGVLEYSPVYASCDNKEDPFISFLKLAKSALKPDGILIIAIENKIGIKYWSGCQEDHTEKIYDGIHGYPIENTPKTFSKAEINDLLGKVGFKDIDFYYQFPDYKFATDIFSNVGDDRKQYFHNWISIPFSAYNIQRKNTFHEGLALKTLSEAGLLREFSNSFLIIAGNKSYICNKPDWIAKKFSLNRSYQYQCVTILKQNPEKNISKKRLNGEIDKKKVGTLKVGDIHLQVTHQVYDSPWYEGDSLVFDIYKAQYIKDFKSEILKIMREYYQELINRYHHGDKDAEGYPLLDGCSIDIILKNMIRNKENKLLPIDIEWCVEGNIPADFVVYRCILDISNIASIRIKNRDKFTMELLKNLFPQYGKFRHNKNKKTEDEFQNLTSNGANRSKITSLDILSLVHHNFARQLIIKVWYMLPNNLQSISRNTLNRVWLKIFYSFSRD